VSDLLINSSGKYNTLVQSMLVISKSKLLFQIIWRYPEFDLNEPVIKITLFKSSSFCSLNQKSFHSLPNLVNNK